MIGALPRAAHRAYIQAGARARITSSKRIAPRLRLCAMNLLRWSASYE
jgi:hypothetical protein